jgi:hypothetical protein
MSMARIISSSLSINCPDRRVALALAAPGKILPAMTAGKLISRRCPAAFFPGRGGQPSSLVAGRLLLRCPTAFFSSGWQASSPAPNSLLLRYDKLKCIF